MVFRLLALLGLLVGLAFGAQAQDVSDADRAAIRDIIQSQVDAFRRDDGDAAFGYASPSIRGMFGSSEIFMDMVRQGYPAGVSPPGVRLRRDRDAATARSRRRSMSSVPTAGRSPPSIR